MRDPILYLDDMIIHARAAHTFVAGMPLDAFAADTAEPICGPICPARRRRGRA